MQIYQSGKLLTIYVQHFTSLDIYVLHLGQLEKYENCPVMHGYGKGGRDAI